MRGAEKDIHAPGGERLHPLMSLCDLVGEGYSFDNRMSAAAEAEGRDQAFHNTYPRKR